MNVERFFSNVLPEPNSGCHLWAAYANAQGYGVMRIGGRVVLAHRAAYEHIHGAIPDGACVLHRCDVPACVNPDHLFLGTRADNMRDMAAKGRSSRQKQWATGRCERGHDITNAENVYVPPSGERACFPCMAEANRRSYAKKLAKAS